jgi:S-adenosylmethionine synthetase
MHNYVFTCESVSEGHPDKVCDYISDSVLDAHLTGDPLARVACETLSKSKDVVLAGEITSSSRVNYESVVRQAIREIGYTDPREEFNADAVNVQLLLTAQAADISHAVGAGEDQGAGDQGLMFGYATDETAEMMPLPILLAHRLSRGLAADRKSGAVTWIRPDAKTQVSVRYEAHQPVQVATIVVSTQHWPETTQEEIRDYARQVLLPRELGKWFHSRIELLVNPSGEFAIGGPTGDCGLTGRKIIVDTYGGLGRHGGGAFSGKDPSKVDRTGAYFARFVAKQIVAAGLARRAEIQVSYAIGRAVPVSLYVDTFGTGNEQQAAQFIAKYDFRPAAIVERLGLKRPLYRQTTNYGHFGKPELPWEQIDRSA